jgi:protein-tyrosine-phosphatase
MEPDSASGAFSVAFVCTGNRFRSVVAEAAFRSAAEGLPVRVVSYGTLELGPVEPLPDAVREADALGLDISTHLARSLADADLTQMSLVLGFELRHAVAAVDVAGARPERVFILPELVDLLDRTGVVRRPDLVDQAVENIARAHASRRADPRRRPGPEIEDPISLPGPAQKAIAQAVHAGTEALALQLFGRDELPADQPGGRARPFGRVTRARRA